MSAAPIQPDGVNRSNIRAWLELIRLPNAATAWADVLMGFLITHEGFAPWYVLALLLVSSTALYWAGMVLNDVFDMDVDQQERPGRPIPSGRIPWQSAVRAGVALLSLGVLVGWIASAVVGDVRPGLIATLLSGGILLYDGVVKSWPIAPAVMGVCRFLNVLLGMSTSSGPWYPMFWIIAAGIGVYVAGITWYARSEARDSNRLQLIWGMIVMGAGLGLLAWIPKWEDKDAWLLSNLNTPGQWQLLIGMLGLLIGYRAMWGVVDGSATRVQMAVKQAIMSLIVIDASICFMFRGFEGALPILILIVPALVLGRWLYST